MAIISSPTMSGIKSTFGGKQWGGATVIYRDTVTGETWADGGIHVENDENNKGVPASLTPTTFLTPGKKAIVTDKDLEKLYGF